jgi:hypothetical protein
MAVTIRVCLLTVFTPVLLAWLYNSDHAFLNRGHFMNAFIASASIKSMLITITDRGSKGTHAKLDTHPSTEYNSQKSRDGRAENCFFLNGTTDTNHNKLNLTARLGTASHIGIKNMSPAAQHTNHHDASMDETKKFG